MKPKITTLTIALFFGFGLCGSASAGTFFGALSNFDAVNDTGSRCNGFEIELDDIQSKDVTYTFQFQRYGTPKITEDTFLVSGVSHPRTFIRWMSSYDQVNHVFTKTTPVAPAGFKDTGGHLCFMNMNVNGQPYDTAGCEHFGAGTLTNASATTYRWMKEDPTTPGSLIAQGSAVTIPAPTWTVNAGVVAAVIPVPPPPAVVPVPYLPNAEFGVAVWAKVFETESAEKADLHHLVSDNVDVPGNHGPVANPNAVTEIEWQILQTDTMNPTANELKSERQIGAGNESVTRRYEFYKYIGPYDINSPDGPNTGTNEALCAAVDPDGMHGVGTHGGFDCSALVVVGEYIGAQNAAADIATPLSANGTQLADAEVGVKYPDRPLIFGGSGGPFSIGFTAGTLPATDVGQEFGLDETTGLLTGGIPNGAAMASFTVHATDLVEPAQPAVDATFNITVVAAVTVDDVVIPDGAPNVETAVNLTASGGETPFIWSATPITAGLQASVVGNTLSVTGNAAGAFDVHVTVDDVLGGTHAKTLTFHVGAPVQPTTTPTSTAITPTPTDTATPSPTATPTLTATATATPTVAPTPVSGKDAEKCRAALVSAAAALVQAEVKAERSCEDKKVGGKLAHDTSCPAESKTSAAITKARSKLVGTVEKACGGKDKKCGVGNDDLPLTSAGWQAPLCPGVEGGACTNAIATCADIATCLTCIGEATVDEAMSLYYDDLVQTDPSVKAQKALNKCQATIGSAATTFFAAKSKALQKCWAAVNAGHATGTCPVADGKAANAIAKAEAKKVAAICKACGGADKVCGGGDDFTPTQIGFGTTCPDVTPPGASSCTGAITTLQDLVNCVDCVTELEVDCAISVAVPALAAYPTECNP